MEPNSDRAGGKLNIERIAVNHPCDLPDKNRSVARHGHPRQRESNQSDRKCANGEFHRKSE
jgi:hypothetical protein